MSEADPLSPEAQLLVFVAEEAAAQAELTATSTFSRARRDALREQLTRLSGRIERLCARHGLARPT